MCNKIILISVLFILNTVAYAENIVIHKNEASGLLTWTVDDTGFRMELIQLLPDFIRAIYAKHNFPEEEVERVASYCVFGTILKNTSNQHLTYRVSNWSYQTKDGKAGYGKKQPVKTKTQWLEEWKKTGIIIEAS